MHKLDIPKIKIEATKTMKLSLPLVASQVLYSSTGFLSTLMLARLGQNVLAATVLVSMIWMVLSVTFFCVLNAVSVLVSHQHGSKNIQGVSHVMRQAFILSVILIIVITLLLMTAPWFLHLAHLPSEVIGLAKSYLNAMRLWIPPVTFMIMLEQFLIGLGKTRVVMGVSILLVPLQILLIYCFIFGKWIFPATGIAGVGYGIALADTLGLVALIIYLLTEKQFKIYGLFSRLEFNWQYLKELIKIGFPMGVMTFIEVGAFTMMTYMIAYFGTMQLAAHQIILQFLGLMITIVFAMSQAVTVRVGHAVGALDREGVNYAIGVGMGINACIMLVLVIIVLLFPHWLIGLDINTQIEKNAALVHQVTLLFHVIVFLMLFENFRIIGLGALRGIKDTHFPMIASLIAFWFVGLSLSFFFGFLLNAETVGIWLGMTVGIFIGAVLVIWRIINQLQTIDLVSVRAID